MKNTKKAFTMIELIFVIVIIGILASIAIPRLSATRDDAKVAMSLHELALLVREMGSYYTAHEKYDTGLNKIKDLTNLELYDNINCSTLSTSISSTNTYYFCTDKPMGLEACASIIPNNSSGLLRISSVGVPIGNICKGIHTAPQFINNITKTFKMGGERIIY